MCERVLAANGFFNNKKRRRWSWCTTREKTPSRVSTRLLLLEKSRYVWDECVRNGEWCVLCLDSTLVHSLVDYILSPLFKTTLCVMMMTFALSCNCGVSVSLLSSNLILLLILGMQRQCDVPSYSLLHWLTGSAHAICTQHTTVYAVDDVRTMVGIRVYVYYWWDRFREFRRSLVSVGLYVCFSS